MLNDCLMPCLAGLGQTLIVISSAVEKSLGCAPVRFRDDES